MEDVVAEAEHLAAQGVRELVLIAQDSANYGLDLYEKPMLPALLRALTKIKDIAWIRVLYSYPKYFSDELIEVFATEPKVVKYVDLPLQHAHDAVLRSMNRPDTREGVEKLIKRLRERIPGVANYQDRKSVV